MAEAPAPLSPRSGSAARQSFTERVGSMFHPQQVWGQWGQEDEEQQGRGREALVAPVPLHPLSARRP